MKRAYFIYLLILLNLIFSQNDGTPPSLMPISASSDYYVGDDITIESFVEDQSEIRDVLLFYKFEKSDRTFQVINMNSTSNIYQGTIPAEEVEDDQFEYYVMAVDEFGNKSTWPNQDLYDPSIFSLSDSSLDTDGDGEKGEASTNVEINLISPTKLVAYESGVSLIMVSIFDPDEEINTDDIKIFVDKKNVTSLSIVSTEMVTFVPQELLESGEHTIELKIPSSNIYRTLTFRVMDQIDSEDAASSFFTNLKENYNLKGSLSWNADFDEAESRPDDSHKLNVTSKFNLGDFKFSASGLFNTHIIDKEALTNLSSGQDINRKKFIMSSPWLDFKYGDFTPDFTHLTLKGTRVRGLFTKVKLGFLNVTYVDGETKNFIEAESSEFLKEILSESEIDNLNGLGYQGYGNGAYDVGEEFTDSNQNQIYDGSCNGAEGILTNKNDCETAGKTWVTEEFEDSPYLYGLHKKGTTERKLTGIRSQLNLFDIFTWGFSGFSSYDDSESIQIPEWALDQYGLYGNLVLGSDVGFFLNGGRTRLVAETAISAYNNILDPYDMFTDDLGVDVSNVQNILGFPITNDLILGKADGRGLSIPLPAGNGVWDEGEEFIDCYTNNNDITICEGDLAEPFEDENDNGVWDEGEALIDDLNNNGVWNGSWNDQLGNGEWDEGEVFEDDPTKNVNYMDYLIDDVIKRGTYRVEFRTPINFDFAKFDILSEIKRVPTNFSSLGNSGIQSDIISSKTSIKSKIFRDQISLSFGIENQEDNVNGKTSGDKTKPVTTKSEINNFGIGMNITGLPKISYAYRKMERVGTKVELPKWDEGELFVDGNGEYDEGEEFEDSNDNGLYDSDESFTDALNGVYDLGEHFIDDPISGNNLTTTHTISPSYKLKLGAQSYNLSGNFMFMKYDDKENSTLNFSNNSYSLSTTIKGLSMLTISTSLGLSSNTPNDKTQSPTNFTVVSGKASYKFSDSFSSFFGVNFVKGSKDKNGIYDSSESYIDALNSIHDSGEEFEDSNGNGVYDSGEPFTDALNGEYDTGEEFIDLATIDNFKSTYKTGLQYKITNNLNLTFSLDYLVYSDNLDSSNDKAEFKSKLQFKYQF